MFHFGAGKRLCNCTTSHRLCGHTTLGEKPYRCRCDDALLAHRTVDDCCDTCESVRAVSVSSATSTLASESGTSSHFEFGDGKALCSCTTTFGLCGHTSLGEKPEMCRCGEGSGRERFVVGFCGSCPGPWL
ncbi:hypothetical protein G7Y79_00001g002900 [Physcia stellaris]|nr:hypothetical protein G7Y79_00001g002900 [Physcia stellaris]